jgi:hypothetical protein
MVDIPGFLNKADFYGKVLPGYIIVLLYLFLFKPELLIGAADEAGNLTSTLSADIFTAVVFLVAGPAVGFSLYLFHRYMYTIKYGLSGHQSTRDNRKNFVQDYAKVRIFCNDGERLELDNVESEYDFSVSTAIGLLIIGAYYVFSNINFEHLEIKIGIFIFALFLLLGVRFHNIESYSPLTNTLIQKYKNKPL